MSKKPVKKSAAKKKSVVKKATGAKTSAKSKLTAGKAVKAVLKKKVKKASSPKKSKTAPKKGKIIPKKSEKEIEFRAANVIANSEKKKRKPLTKLKGKVKVKSERPDRTLTLEEASALTKAVVEGMRERKAKNIAVLDLREIENRVCDTFVICDADSKTHVMSIAESVEEMVFKLVEEKAYKSEGQENSEWILVDYVNVVAHIFLRETREHYNIEGLWGDAKFTLINN